MEAVAPRPPSRDYRPWTEADSVKLRTLAGRSYSEAARLLGREKSTIRKAAKRLGIVMGCAPPIGYEVTIEEVFAALEEPASATTIADRYKASPARVNGLLSTLLRDGRVIQTFGRKWARNDECEIATPAKVIAARQEAATYEPTGDDLTVRQELIAGDVEVCGACVHYDGPLVRPPGGQLRGRCLVLALDVIPATPDHPCGKCFTLAV